MMNSSLSAISSGEIEPEDLSGSLIIQLGLVTEDLSATVRG